MYAIIVIIAVGFCVKHKLQGELQGKLQGGHL
jgi:hypothetical protein